MYEQQQIPANYEAEQAVVGALIIGGNVDELTTEVNLTPDDFYFSDCKLVYKCILYLNDKNDKIDIVTVDSTLKTANLKISCIPVGILKTLFLFAKTLISVTISQLCLLVVVICLFYMRLRYG
jgi:replicative DNA helicase